MAQTSLPRYLRALESIGVIEKAVPYGENPETSKRGMYRLSESCYAFWFRFVMPFTSILRWLVAGRLSMRPGRAKITEYLGHRFEALCAEWLVEQAKKGKLPIAATAVSSWWGTNPDKRAQDDIDVLAADRIEKRLIIGECKYRESFDETVEIDDLESKRNLVKGYAATNFMLFTKREVSVATRVKLANRGDWRLVTLEDMYAE